VTRHLVVSREARTDVAEAVAWFRNRSPQLPDRFRTALESVYQSIVEHPEMHPVVYRRFRRALLHTFPYSVFYVIDPAKILIIGVVHQARYESTWKRRT